MMNDRYLWDGSGEPDPEFQRLESLLSEFRHGEIPLVLPPEAAANFGYFHGLFLGVHWLPRFAAIVVVILALITGGIFSVRRSPLSPSGPGWVVARLDGTPQIGTQFITAGQASARLRVGQTLETNSSSRASISENDLGEIKVDPNSRLRLLQTGDHRKRIQLDVGTIHAMIWAPPGEFVVDTPSAVAVDLGSLTPCRSLPMALARYALLSAGSVSISMAASPLSLPAPCAPRGPKLAPAYHTSKTLAKFSARLLAILISPHKPREPVQFRSQQCSPERAQKMASLSGIYYLARRVPNAPKSTIALQLSFLPRPGSPATESSISISPCSISGGTPSTWATSICGVIGNNPLLRELILPTNSSRRNRCS